MIRNYWNEEWKDVVFDEKISKSEKFKISNYGRVIKYKDGIEHLLDESFVNGYQVLRLHLKEKGKWTSRYVHKLVAEHFLDSEGKKYVIHLDYNKTNNRVENLKWASKREKEIHQFENPTYKNSRPRITYSKLTETKVKLIKRKINDPNRRTRMKMIAKQFGVSEMQLYRIKTGENWSHVTEY
ncbi:HNH endonuclease [Joostella sp. CR20]|uniref:HNH endonuclease n=1 Tax=Joostella sp. CR20 TaxID=2804312 RepID=UPI00313B76B3